jgi:hypothetical protein
MLFASAERAAQSAVETQFGHFDEYDPQLGAAYDKVFYALLAERCPNLNMDDLLSILNS